MLPVVQAASSPPQGPDGRWSSVAREPKGPAGTAEWLKWSIYASLFTYFGVAKEWLRPLKQNIVKCKNAFLELIASVIFLSYEIRHEKLVPSWLCLCCVLLLPFAVACSVVLWIKQLVFLCNINVPWRVAEWPETLCLRWDNSIQWKKRLEGYVVCLKYGFISL